MLAKNFQGSVNLIFILIIGLLALFGGGMIYLSQTKSSVTPPITPQPEGTTAPLIATPIPITIDPEQKWKIYQNTLYSLNYPSQLQLNEYKESTYSGIELSLPQTNPSPTMNVLTIKNSKQKALDLADSLRQLETGDPNSTGAVISELYGGAVNGRESFEYSVKNSEGQRLVTVVDVDINTLLKVTMQTYKDQHLMHKERDLLPYILNNLQFK